MYIESLEMLSNQCKLKLEQIKSAMNSDEVADLNDILEEVNELCATYELEPNITTTQSFENNLKTAIEPFKNEISINNLIKVKYFISLITVIKSRVFKRRYLKL